MTLISANFLAISSANAAETRKQKMMARDLQTIEGFFDTAYAPADWKKAFSGWVLENEIADAKAKVLANPEITTKDFQKILRDFFYSTKDYHVGAKFYSTERALLPLEIRGSQGRYFIVNINRDELSAQSFPYNVGDELISIGGRSVEDEITKLKAEVGQNSDLTDQALAELYLTFRTGSNAMTVPSGNVVLGIKRKGSNTVSTHQLTWIYSSESIGELPSLPTPEASNSRRLANPSTTAARAAHLLQSKQMISPIAEELSTRPGASASFNIGSKTSFIPALGSKIWSTGEKDLFDAYIFQDKDRKLMGYVRIPSYVAGAEHAAEFAEIIRKLETHTEGLVIDQVNNPGGSVFYLYALASMLSDKALYTPRHRMTITQADVAEALFTLPELRKIRTDEEAKLFFGDTVGGFPVDKTFVHFTIKFFQFMVDEWNAGRQLTRPYHLWGADQINPSKVAQYTKPILLLTNELDFSGGDFFPAILQDNKRVTILGTRTAGAGGYVMRQSFPNIFGLGFFSLTGSIAERVDQNPIENLGVTPDVPYALTPEDFQNNFKGYTQSILSTLRTLISE